MLFLLLYLLFSYTSILGTAERPTFGIQLVVQCTEMWESGGQSLKLDCHADNTKSDPKSDLCVCVNFSAH